MADKHVDEGVECVDGEDEKKFITFSTVGLREILKISIEAYESSDDESIKDGLSEIKFCIGYFIGFLDSLKGEEVKISEL